MAGPDAQREHQRDADQSNGRRLGALLLNPPTGPGTLTIGRVRLAAGVVGAAEVGVANMLSTPTRCSKGITEVGASEAGWLEARPAIVSLLEESDDVLLAWGTSPLTGPARIHLRAQIAWVRDTLATSRHERVWMLAGEPRHPSRWHRYVSDKYERTAGGSLEDRIREVLQPIEVSKLAAGGGAVVHVDSRAVPPRTSIARHVTASDASVRLLDGVGGRRVVGGEGYRVAMTAVTELPDDAVDRYADALSLVAEALARDDIDAARLALQPIAGERWEGRFALAGTPGVGSAAAGARDVSAASKARIFVRDRMRCTYCGGRVIPRGLLVAISDVFPEEFPYYAHYKKGTVHPAYWAVAPEADHVEAHSGGGAGDDDNLTTLHVACNTIKSDSRAEDMPAVEARPAPKSWDGLVAQYPGCVRAGNRHGRRHHKPGYHAERMRHLGVRPLEDEIDPS